VALKSQRNELCPCGSGKKFKRCCGADQPAQSTRAAAGADRPGQQAEARRPAPGAINQLIELLNAQRYLDAEGAARRLIEQHPNFGFAWKLLGVALTMQGKDGTGVLQQAAEFKPDDAETHFLLGNAWQDRQRLTDAVASYRRAIGINPQFAEAHNNLGTALRDLGQLNEAVAGHTQALQINPELTDAHINMGNAQLKLRQPEQAAAYYRRALQINPNLSEAHNNLGVALRDLGQLAEAAASFRQALQIQPNYASAHNNLGNALMKERRIDEAVLSYRRALTIRPDFAEAYNNLGIALRDLGQLQEALNCFGQALSLKANYAAAHSNLGNVLLDLQRLEEAAASYRRALALKPDDAESLTSLSAVLRLQGRGEEAESHCRQALEAQPDSASAATLLGEILADQGQFAEANELFRRAIAIAPDLAPAWASIPRYRKMDTGDQPWLAGAQQLADQPQPLRHQISLRYAIGEYFDDMQNYEQAFINYRTANDLTKRYGAVYDREQLARRIDQIRSAFDQKWLRRMHPWSNPSERPLFIVGMPGSGTTLAGQILASHPDAFSAGELEFWNAAAASMGSAAVPGATADSSDPNRISRLAAEYLRMLTELSPGALRVVDRMPGNFLQLGLIHAAFPLARIIHLRRNPIDTCLSIYFQQLAPAHAYANDLDDLAHYYTEYHRLMQHWQAALPQGAMLELSYEGLVEEPEPWAHRLVEFAGLPWDSACLDFHLSYRTVITSSRWQVRQQISKSSVGRWHHYESFVAPLKRLLELDSGA
jgi:tetratricopeptide (TPR) repeat protein